MLFSHGLIHTNDIAFTNPIKHNYFYILQNQSFNQLHFNIEHCLLLQGLFSLDKSSKNMVPYFNHKTKKFIACTRYSRDHFLTK